MSLQAQIISLQKQLVTIFLYGPTSSDPISHQLATINATSRTVGMASVDILVALQSRRENAPSVTHRMALTSAHATPHATRASGTTTTTTTLTKYEAPRLRSGSPANTTVLDWNARSRPAQPDTETTSTTEDIASGTSSASQSLYCPYSLDLQRHATQSLSSTVTNAAIPHCPSCQGTLHLSSGKAWELFKEDEDFERCFQVSNRFVVKCHRGGPDGQYACVICSRSSSAHITVCGDVKALVKHLWSDHSIRELKHEGDIVEVIERPSRDRRDSGTGYGASRNSWRSASLASSRRRKSLPAYEREVEVFDVRPPRRRA